MLEEGLFGHSRILVHWVPDHFKRYRQPLREHVVLALFAPSVHKDDLLHYSQEPILFSLAEFGQSIWHRRVHELADCPLDVSRRRFDLFTETLEVRLEAIRKVVLEPAEQSSDVQKLEVVVLFAIFCPLSFTLFKREGFCFALRLLLNCF